MEVDTIEYMNAHGPYDHGIWTAALGEGEAIATFGTSSLFATRAEVMSEKIVAFLKSHYSEEQLKAFNIVDIGCYDGWVLTQISSQIEFASAIGVEPRQKNIDKGTFARNACSISSKCEFVRGGYKDLDKIFPDKVFDIVLCLGMLHHVNSVEDAIRSISAKCSKLFIVDSMIIPSLKNDFEEISSVINPVDIVYRKKEKMWGMAAYKLETPYFDGSTSDCELVNIPQESLIRMCLQVSGFSQAEALMSEKDFYPEEFQKLRGVNELMLASFRDADNEKPKNSWIDDALRYEQLFCLNPVSQNFLMYLYEKHKSEELSEYFLAIFNGVFPSGAEGRAAEVLTEEEREIAGTISRAPFEKIMLELAKFYLMHENFEAAESLLCKITVKKNSDWRSFYRACYLLINVEAKLGRHSRAEHYKKLLLISNPLFPLLEA